MHEGRVLSVAATCALAFALPANAVNKCTMPDGRVAYQDAPCPSSTAQAQSIATAPNQAPMLATRTTRPYAPAARAPDAPTLQIPPPTRIEFSGLPQSDLSKATAAMDKMRAMGRDCEWALKVDQTKMQLCVAFLTKVQPRGELEQIGARVADVQRYEPAALRQSAADVRKLGVLTDEVLRYKDIAMSQLNLSR